MVPLREIVKELLSMMQKFNYKDVMEIPRPKKVVINIGVGKQRRIPRTGWGC